MFINDIENCVQPLNFFCLITIETQCSIDNSLHVKINCPSLAFVAVFNPLDCSSKPNQPKVCAKRICRFVFTMQSHGERMQNDIVSACFTQELLSKLEKTNSRQIGILVSPENWLIHKRANVWIIQMLHAAIQIIYCKFPPRMQANQYLSKFRMLRTLVEKLLCQ
ncbi:hypothetical protein D3C87_1462000 [compost metagenome]